MSRLSEQFLNVSLDGVIHQISETARSITAEHQTAANETTPVGKDELTAQTWSEHGVELFLYNNYADAIQCFTKAIDLQPNFGIYYFKRGYPKMLQGDLDGAIKDYTKAIQLKDKEFNFYNAYYEFRGDAQVKKGDFDSALIDYTEALRLKPVNSEALVGRGTVYLHKRDLDRAIDDFSEVIRLETRLH